LKASSHIQAPVIVMAGLYEGMTFEEGHDLNEVRAGRVPGLQPEGLELVPVGSGTDTGSIAD
jgi:hypothetical protein